MGSILRFLALAGVISAGSYMLYQAETRLSESESLTQSESTDNTPVSLGVSSGDSIPSLEENAPKQFEPDPSSLFVEDSVDSNNPPLNGNDDRVSDDQPDLDFNNATVTTADGTMSDDDPFGSVKLASDEAPVLEAPPKNSADEFPEFEPLPPLESKSDPFGETPAEKPADPFGELPALDSNQPPVEKTNETVPALKIPLPDEFPELEKNDSGAADPFGETPPELPEPAELKKPVTEPDPFAPLPSEAKPEVPVELEKSSNEADPFGDSPLPSEPNPFSEADKFEAVKKTENKTTELLPVITPAKSSQKTVSDPFGSYPPPKITPKSNTQTTPFESDDQLPRISPARTRSNSESDPFSTAQPKPKISPASAEDALPIITPKNQPKEFDPFSSGSPTLKEPAKFPEPFERKSSPEPKELEEAFPLPEPSPTSSPFLEPAATKTPAPEADAFPAIEEQPSVKTPAVSDPFGEAEKPVKTDETPIDDSFQFPPLPKATPEGAPSASTTPADAFPSLDPIDEPASPAKPEPSVSEVKPLPLPSSPENDDPISELKELPGLSSDPELSRVKQPAAPKELKDPGVSKPLEPRSVPLPQLVIEKLAPEKAVLQQPFVYHILVKNTGTTAVEQVTVQDQVPRGTKLTGTIPQAELTGERLVWKLDRMQPGDEKKISIRVIPLQAGPIGSVATVNYVAEVGAETVIEVPKIEFRMMFPPEARVGEVVTCRFDIENKGDQTITGLVLRDVLPEGLYHPSGQDLENPLGDLKPGDRIVEQLQLKVMKTGEITNTAYLGAEGGLRLEAFARLEANSNTLTVERRGPKRRVVGSPAIYHNVVKNISNRTVSDALVIEQLPQGMEFVSASADGEFHEKGRTIFWKLPPLQPGQSVVLQSRVIPREAGAQESLVRVVESPSSKSEIKAISHTDVDPVEAVGVVMSEHRQPVQIGDSVIMTIEATNRGQKPAQNVRIRAAIPPSLSLMNVRGETRFRIEGREVVFEPLNEMVPGYKETIQLELKAAASSTAKVSVTIQSDKMSQPVQQASALSIQNVVR